MAQDSQTHTKSGKPALPKSASVFSNLKSLPTSPRMPFAGFSIKSPRFKSDKQLANTADKSSPRNQPAGVPVNQAVYVVSSAPSSPLLGGFSDKLEAFSRRMKTSRSSMISSSTPTTPTFPFNDLRRDVPRETMSPAIKDSPEASTKRAIHFAHPSDPPNLSKSSIPQSSSRTLSSVLDKSSSHLAAVSTKLAKRVQQQEWLHDARTKASQLRTNIISKSQSTASLALSPKATQHATFAEVNQISAPHNVSVSRHHSSSIRCND